MIAVFIDTASDVILVAVADNGRVTGQEVVPVPYELYRPVLPAVLVAAARRKQLAS